MAYESGCGVVISSNEIPYLDGVQEYVEVGMLSDGARANERYYSQFVSFERNLDDCGKTVLYDPQTSGGLLLSVSSSCKDMLINKLHVLGVSDSRVVGEFIEDIPGSITVR